MSEVTYWGYELRINAAGCNHEALTNHDTIAAFSKQLVKDIDMVAWGEPLIPNFGHGDKSGYSLHQFIETSNIDAHFVNEYNHIYLNIFSCKRFDSKIVLKLVKEYFSATHWTYDWSERQAPSTSGPHSTLD